MLGRLRKFYSPNIIGGDENLSLAAFSLHYTLLGTGLGFAIAEEIVRRHDGRFIVENRSEEGGATFTVCLPALHSLGETKNVEPEATRPQKDNSDCR